MRWKHSALNYIITLLATTTLLINLQETITRTVLFAPSPGNRRTRGKHLITFFSLAGTLSRSTKKNFRRFLGNGYAARIDYFGGFDSNNVCRNLFLNIVSFLFKFYIWKCKLRFRIPGEEESIDFAKSHITTFFSLNKNFRETWTESGINFRF